MTLVVTTRTLIGKGKASIRNRTQGGLLRLVGNTSKYAHAISEDKKTLPNMETAGGGNAATLSRIKDYTGSIDLRDFNAANIALAMRGGIISEDAASVSAEAHTAYTGGFVLFDHLPDMGATVTPVIAVSTARTNSTAYAKGNCILASSVVYQCTTAGTSDGSAPTYSTGIGTTTTDGTVTWTSRGAVTMVDGTDYQLGNAGIEILEAATRFALGLPITVAYSQNAADLIQLLTASQDEYEIVLDGLNEVDSGNPFVVHLYRVKFSPAASQDWKGDDFATLSLSFEALPDSTKTGTGISQYGRIILAA